MILIINSAGTFEEETLLKKKDMTELPYGSSVITSALRQKGFDVIHKDLRNLIIPLLKSPPGYKEFSQYLNDGAETESITEYFQLSLDFLPDLSGMQLIGFSVFSHVNYYYALALAKKLKSLHPDCPVCFGGAFITIKKLTIPPFVDYFIKGNGGTPVIHLADHFVNNRELNPGLPGLAYNNGIICIDNGKNQDEADMEPIPDFSDLDLKRYLRPDTDNKQLTLTVPYRLSLGCTNQCSFCTGRFVDDKARFKSADKVVSEIIALNKLSDNVMFRFTDASINNSKRILTQVLDKLIAKKVPLKWRAYAKMNNMDEEFLNKLRASGCDSLVWGLENASPHMIRVFNKKYDVAKAGQILNKSIELGIKNLLLMIFNGPGETTEDLEINQDFINKYRSKPNITFDIFDFYLEEGSDICNNPDKYGIEILGRPDKDDYTIREGILWKEKGLTCEAFNAKVKEHSLWKERFMQYRDERLYGK